MKKKTTVYSSTDFNENLLPSDRKQQFKFILHTRKNLLFNLGILLLMFSIPLIVALTIKDRYVYNFFLMFQNETINEDEFFAFFELNHLIFSLIGCACYMILSIPLAGIFEIFKKLTYSEPIFIKEDFKKGIKNNTLIFLFISLSICLEYLLISLLYYLLGMHYFVLLFIFLFIFIFIPLGINMYCYASTYKCSILQLIHNSFQLFVLHSFKGILISLGLVVIPITFNVLAELLKITPMVNTLIMILYIVIYVPIYILMIYLYKYSLFDDKLNKEKFPSFYKKGLYIPNKKD